MSDGRWLPFLSLLAIATAIEGVIWMTKHTWPERVKAYGKKFQ